MLILELRKDKNFLDTIRRKVKRLGRKGIFINIFIGESRIVITSVEMGLAVALLYSIYVSAKEKGLEPEMYYAFRVNPNELLPMELKKIGEEWASRKLRKEEFKYRDKVVVKDLLERLGKARLLLA